MIILAVSDDRSQLLEQILCTAPQRLKDVGLIVSCGDLDFSYVELLADAIDKPLQFVLGNHPGEISHSQAESRFKTHPEKESSQYIAGSKNLHGRIKIFGDYILIGFSGSIWYNGEGTQFTEEEMNALVKKAIRKLKWIRLEEFVTGRNPRKVIVISHSPILGIHDEKDDAHRGFQCFKIFMENVHPVLWIHGHIHVNDLREKQMTVVGDTTVVNACGHKFIFLDDDEIKISIHPKVPAD